MPTSQMDTLRFAKSCQGRRGRGATAELREPSTHPRSPSLPHPSMWLPKAMRPAASRRLSSTRKGDNIRAVGMVTLRTGGEGRGACYQVSQPKQLGIPGDPLLWIPALLGQN